MGDGYNGRAWGDYIRRISKRPGWSVARLYRETTIAKSTFWDWMNATSTKAVTIPYIVAVAKAVGDDPIDAFKAAAGLTTDEPEDVELSLVLSSDIPDDAKDEIIASILKRRDMDRVRRMEDTIQMIALARDRVA